MPVFQPELGLQRPANGDEKACACFVRPLHTPSGSVVTASISQTSERELHVRLDSKSLPDADQDSVISQASLRLECYAGVSFKFVLLNIFHCWKVSMAAVLCTSY